MFQKIYVSWLPLHHLDHLQDWKRDTTTQSVIIWDKKKKKKDFPESLQEQILLKCINDFSVFHFPGFKEQKSHRWIIFSNHFWTSQSECAKNTIQLWCLQSIPIATAWLYYYDHCSDRCVGLFSRSPERTLLALSVILAGNFTSSC